ncbi:MAG: methyltransferase domain-containing protein [Kiritimatiellae bacterium]|nr:methyltransferase domain-containing protein [Kiritimatiellia bacterium]MDD3543843.1 methyltransferase domain-containing protein [Kiritimatiellia bacterium]MDD4025514.1 methyltransferase domain-containing protein [Kiritimatiellia bacterium]MDD4622165.1 methyltransferase domain-containing protein [Kiritimatiellia bacterium]
MKPRDLAYCAVFGAAALLLPTLFHALQLGRVFMPMYLPLVLLAFYVPPGPAALTALLIPALSGAVTGMPTLYPQSAPVMSLELAALPAIIRLLRQPPPAPDRDPRVPFFDKIAPEWDGWHDLPKVREQLLGFLDRFHLLPDERVLDLGCGTGNLTLALLERLGPAGRVTAADISPAMLALARGKTRDPRVTWIETAAENLPLPPHSFDRAFCFSSWPHFRDPSAVLDGFRRILRPGGHAHILHFISRQEVNRIHSETGDHSVHGDLLPPVTEVSNLFTAAGFEVLETADSENIYLLIARLPEMKKC